MRVRIHHRSSAIVAVLLSIAIALSGVLLDGPSPAQAETPRPGPIVVAADPCDSATTGVAESKASRVRPSAACGTGQTATGQTVSPPRQSRPATTQTAAPAATGIGARAAAKPGLIYVVDVGCCIDNGGAVIEVDPSKPAGANQRIVSEGQFLGSPYSGALAPDGMIYVINLACCETFTPAVIRVDPSQPAANNQTIVSQGQHFGSPYVITSAPDGTLYVSDIGCCGTNTGAVIRVDPSQPAASNQTIASQGQSFMAPYGMAVTPDGRLYVVDATCCASGSGGVIRVDPSQPNTNNQTIISQGQNFGGPLAGALAADGMLYVADGSCCAINTNVGAVIRVDPSQPAASNQTIVSQGQSFLNPTDIALAADGTLRVLDATCCANAKGGIIQVNQNLSSGSNQFLISDGQSFTLPQGISVVPQVAIADAAPVTEGTGASVPTAFTVTRAPFSSLPLTVPFTVTGGANGSPNGAAAADLATTSGMVTFPAGQTTATATVQVVGDALAEPTEAFTVALNVPNGVAVTTATATGTIADNDGPATLAIGADLTQAEGQSRATTFTFPVTLSPASGPVVTVQYTAVAGTAQAGQDFQATTGTLTFQSGETTKTIEIPVVADAVIEPDEAFAVTLSAPTGSAAIGRATATATITNDDSACTPRPSVVPTPVAGTGKLSVHVASTPLNTQAANPLTEIRFGAFQNGRVILNGQTIAGGQTVTLPPNTTAIDFTVERITAGQATTVPFSVVDGCGEWQTFVGGGAGAF